MASLLHAALRYQYTAITPMILLRVVDTVRVCSAPRCYGAFVTFARYQHINEIFD